MPAHRVFVYGTLKQGFRNFHVNRGTRIGRGFVTAQAYPLYILGPFGLPWLVHEPGRGHPVVGQLFEVDAAGLAEMDWLERVTDADWYTRRPLDVRPLEGGAPLAAVAYFGSAARLASGPCTTVRWPSTRTCTKRSTASTSSRRARLD